MKIMQMCYQTALTFSTSHRSEASIGLPFLEAEMHATILRESGFQAQTQARAACVDSFVGKVKPAQVTVSSRLIKGRQVQKTFSKLVR